MSIKSRIKRLEESRGGGRVAVFEAPEGVRDDAKVEAYCKQHGVQRSDLLIVWIAA